ncbi:IclR family transcriptional regulator [Pseudonocardia kunmingensis]|uniref:IclR family transcriptional regulator n=1 Tax=Pseudonocardia kunmingensis TaxID=630975 RepID=UPI001B8685D3|nr:IclR family transcriptional regulator [Pseudonocardia kunmingensis]
MSDGADTLSSVNRALTLLELLAENNGLTVTQLADRLQTGKTTAFRLTKTLSERGWVEKDDELRYRLGPALLGLVPANQMGQGLRQQLRPLLEELQDETGETIHLTVLRGRYIVYVDQLISPKPVHSVSTLGSRSPAHCVSPGLAQLAALPSEALDWILAVPLRRYTERSLTEPDAVRAELQRVRNRGYAVNRGAFRAEVGGVGAAVLDDHERPVAALSVCMPAFRMKDNDLSGIGELLKMKAADAQRRIRLARRPAIDTF